MSKFIRKDAAPLCACGCGEGVKRAYQNKGWNKFIHSHQGIGRKCSDETRKRMSLSHIGYKHTKEQKRKISIANSGKNNKFYGKKHSEETKKKISLSSKKRRPSKKSKLKMSIAGKGKNNAFYGKKHTEKAKKRMSLAHSGKILSEETKKKMSISTSGTNHPNWQGGITAEPYCDIWLDKEYKQSIKDRDNNECQNPSCWHKSKNLTIHHINYIKKDCNPLNLITLCNSCNTRANFNRDYWIDFYKEIVKEKYGHQYA